MAIKSVSENAAEQIITAILMAIRDGERKAVMGGLQFLFNHLEAGGDLPTNFVTNILDLALAEE